MCPWYVTLTKLWIILIKMNNSNSHKHSIKNLLIITGNDAYRAIKSLEWEKIRKKFKINIIKAEIITAAFMTRKDLEDCLIPYDAQDFDLVLVSGLIAWDVGRVNHPLKSKIKKGPRFLVNLIEILLTFELNKLSSSVPADDLYRSSILANYDEEVAAIKTSLSLEDSSNVFPLSSAHNQILFSPQLPTILLGEIVDFPKLSWEQLCWKIEDYSKKGVDIIDLGCIAGKNHSEYISEQLFRLKERYKAAFSIDSIDESEIHAAVGAGAEMVLSITVDNIQNLLDLPKDIPVVVIPYSVRDPTKSLSDLKVIKRLFSLWEILDRAGFKKIFLDPLLQAPISPGLMNSLSLVKKLSRKIKKTKRRSDGEVFTSRAQVLVGIGNVVELVDADSPGINSILALIAAELDVSAVISSEFSQKSRYSLEELARSLRFAFYAKNQGLPPINMGITALKFKTKQPLPAYASFNETMKRVKPANKKAIMDPKGYFKIYIDEPQGLIYVTHFNNNNLEPDASCTFSGSDAESLYKAVINSNKISRLDHAAYLGRELGKAELALKFGMGYSQN